MWDNALSPDTRHITNNKLSFLCIWTTTITENLPWASEAPKV